jgi:hypothetical protein
MKVVWNIFLNEGNLEELIASRHVLTLIAEGYQKEIGIVRNEGRVAEMINIWANIINYSCSHLFKVCSIVGVGDVAQWKSTCLAFVRPWAPSSALSKNMIKRKK